MRYIILSFIALYQKYISPVKGFKCAYGQRYGNGTCSSRISEIVRNSSFRKIPAEVLHQFKMCELASKPIDNDRPVRKETEECKDKLWGVACGCFSI